LGPGGKKMIEGMETKFKAARLMRTRAMALRAKWVEDLMKEAIAKYGVTQIVNPGNKSKKSILIKSLRT
jgi:hypothetical protein